MVVDVLNKILGDYVVNLDTKQLKIGIWGGKFVIGWNGPCIKSYRLPNEEPEKITITGSLNAFLPNSCELTD